MRHASFATRRRELPCGLGDAAHGGAATSDIKPAWTDSLSVQARDERGLLDLSKYPFDDALQAAARKTNRRMNAYGASVAAVGVVGATYGCPQVMQDATQ